jgi:hypothetical protein
MTVRSLQRLAQRIALSCAIGTLAALYTHHVMSGKPGADDFTYHWLAVRSLIEGKSPYVTVQPGGPFHLNSGYLYPLTTTLVAFPFAALTSPILSASTFVAFSVSLFIYGILRTNRNWLPCLGGIPIFWALASGQQSVLATAGVLLPGMGFLASIKPNLALALFVWRPSRSMVIGSVVLLAASLLVLPHWPMEWRMSVARRTPGNYLSPVRLIGGPLLLLAVLRWRSPEARLLIVMSLVPQTMLFYDQVPLALIPQTKRESMLLVISGFVGYMVASWNLPPDPNPAAAQTVYGPAIVLSLYLPCLIMILLRSTAKPQVVSSLPVEKNKRRGVSSSPTFISGT